MRVYATERAAKVMATKTTKKMGGVQYEAVPTVGGWLVSEKAAVPAIVPKKKGVYIREVLAMNLPLVESIKMYAQGNADYGWDYIVECWTDEDILLAVGRAKSIKGAILKLHGIVMGRNAQEHDVENA